MGVSYTDLLNPLEFPSGRTNYCPNEVTPCELLGSFRLGDWSPERPSLELSPSSGEKGGAETELIKVPCL
jgi:hypothetical protein